MIQNSFRVVVALVGMLSVALSLIPAGRHLETGALQLLLGFIPKPELESALVVVEWPSDQHTRFGEMMEKLAAGKPRLVTSSNRLSPLLSAYADHLDPERVVIPVPATRHPTATTPAELPGLQAVADQAPDQATPALLQADRTQWSWDPAWIVPQSPYTHAPMPADWVDGMPFPYTVRTGSQAFPTLPLLLAAAITRQEPQKILDGTRAAGGLVVPWVQAAVQPVVGGVDLLKGEVASRSLRNRVVYIGDAVEAEAARVQISALIEKSAAIAMFPNATLIQLGVLLGLAALYLMVPVTRSGRLLTAFALFALVALSNTTFFFVMTQKIWIPLAMPILVLVLLHGLHLWFAALAGREFGLRRSEQQLRYALARSQQNQGQLDEALTHLLACVPTGDVLQSLYDLGLEFERRRVWPKAKRVYEHIRKHSPAFRDVGERLKRLENSLVDATLIAAGGVAGNPTLVINHPGAEQPMLGRYRLVREIGRGAMGIVYEGIDPKIGRKVAIKTLALSSEFQGKELEEATARFYREAKAAGRLNHPHVVTVYDVGEEHDLAYIAMDYAIGDSLDNFTDLDNLLPVEDIVTVAIQVADALGYAHEKQVIHRDIKPANIIYDRVSGLAKVTDFGLAKMADASQQTRQGTVMGSPAYMSPEQAQGLELDQRTDLYSLGVTLYRMLGGQLPFAGDTAAVIAQVLTRDPPPLGELAPQLPPGLAQLVMDLLAKDREARPASMSVLVERLREVMSTI